jgi:hypothetical protein
MIFSTLRHPFVRWMTALVVAVCFFVPSVSHAAVLYFGSTGSEQKTGTAWAMGVFLDAEGNRVNAVEGVIEYEANRWSAEAIETGASAVTLWIEPPQLPKDCTAICRIPFKGIIPGGLIGPQIELFRLVGRSLHEGSVVVKASGLRVLAHDGKGTAVPV